MILLMMGLEIWVGGGRSVSKGTGRLHATTTASTCETEDVNSSSFQMEMLKWDDVRVWCEWMFNLNETKGV